MTNTYWFNSDGTRTEMTAAEIAKNEAYDAAFALAAACDAARDSDGFASAQSALWTFCDTHGLDVFYVCENF
jgi:hypothetical protein